MQLKCLPDTRLRKDISGMAPWEPGAGLCDIDSVYRIREVNVCTWGPSPILPDTGRINYATSV